MSSSITGPVGGVACGVAGAAVTSVVELQDTYWIRIAQPTLGSEACRAIRRACLRALERAVPHVVVDLTGVDHVSADGLDLLQAAGEAFDAKRTRLWLANTREDDFAVLPFLVGELEMLHGLSGALDAALAAAARDDLRHSGSERV